MSIGVNEDPQGPRSFLSMIAIVAVAVAVIILAFFVIGYGLGRLLL